MRAQLPRRTLLGLAVAAVAVPVTAACTSSSDPGPDPDEPTNAPTDGSGDEAEAVDAGLRVGAAEAERQLIARYDATIARHPALGAALTPLVEQHREHRSALDPRAAPETGTATESATIPADPSTAVAELIAAERVAAEARTGDCEQARSVDLARLLALVAASEASHAEALAAGGAEL